MGEYGFVKYVIRTFKIKCGYCTRTIQKQDTLTLLAPFEPLRSCSYGTRPYLTLRCGPKTSPFVTYQILEKEAMVIEIHRSLHTFRPTSKAIKVMSLFSLFNV